MTTQKIENEESLLRQLKILDNMLHGDMPFEAHMELIRKRRTVLDKLKSINYAPYTTGIRTCDECDGEGVEN